MLDGKGNFKESHIGRYLIEKPLSYGFAAINPLTDFGKPPRQLLIEAVPIEQEQDAQAIFDRFISVQRVRCLSDATKRVIPVADFKVVGSYTVIITKTCTAKSLDDHLQFPCRFNQENSSLFIERLIEVVHTIALLHDSGIAHGGLSSAAIRMDFNRVNLLHFYAMPETWTSGSGGLESSDLQTLLAILEAASLAIREASPGLSKRFLSRLSPWRQRELSSARALAEDLVGFETQAENC